MVRARPRRLVAYDCYKVGQSFKKGTCSSDGTHPRMVLAITPQGRECLVELHNLCELLGDGPIQVRDLSLALIPKTDGGRRPIGLYRAWTRWRQRIRRTGYQAWEAHDDNDQYLSCCAGRDVTDVVWRQSFAMEVASSSARGVVEDVGGNFGAALLWDLMKAFEHIQHEILVREGQAVGMPMSTLIMDVNSYQWPRRFTMDLIVSRVCQPEDGMVAGATGAPYQIKAYMLRSIRAHCLAHPRTPMIMHIDDVDQRCVGDSLDDVVDTLTDSALALAKIFEVDLKMLIAHKKRAVVSTDERVSRRLRLSLRELAGPRSTAISTRALGIDVAGGRTMKKPERTTYNTRLGKFFRRKRKSERILHSSKKAQSRVMVAGFIPGRTFGVNVTGVEPGLEKSLTDAYAVSAGTRDQGNRTRWPYPLAGTRARFRSL